MQCQITSKDQGLTKSSQTSPSLQYVNLPEQTLLENLSLPDEEKENISLFFPHQSFPCAGIPALCFSFHIVHQSQNMEHGLHIQTIQTFAGM